MTSTLLRGGTIVTSSGEEKADILIEDDIIQSIEGQGLGQGANLKTKNYQLKTSNEEPTIIDVSQKLLFPGLIDCHVHFREPGLTHKGDMRSEAAAAVAGGVTTVCEMPNTVPPTVTMAALTDKVRRATLVPHCDIRFFLGVTEAAHLLAVRDVWMHSSAESTRLRRHCAGVKIYLDHSTGDQGIAAGVLEDVFKLCGELSIPLVAHCEDPDVNAAAARRAVSGQRAAGSVSLHSEMRPPESEVKAVDHPITLARRYGTPLHVAHISTRGALQLVREAKKEDVRVTCEAAPHHLFLTADDYATLGALAKINPPLRSADDQKALWEGIADRTIDCIATDHAPHTLEEKKVADWREAPSGVPGVETMLPLLLTVAAGTANAASAARPDTPILRYSDILRLCFDNPNKIFSLGKEGIREGAKADIVIVDPAEEWTIRGSQLHSKCGWTPYEGWTVRGKVISALILGRER